MPDRRDLQAELQRLVDLLRDHHDDAVISTRIAHADEQTVIAHASIVTGAGPTGSGPSGSGLGSASTDEGAAELAENRALLRALVALGVPIPADEPARLTGPTAVDPPGRVVQFPTHDPEPSHEDDPSPRDARPASSPATGAPSAQPRAATPTVPPAQRPSSPTPAPATAPATRSAASTPAPARTVAPAGPAGADDDPDPADLSWNGFWRWARDHGFNNRLALEEALNQPLGNRPPAEVRQLMRDHLNIDG